MQTVTDLIDAARKALNVSSDAEFARQLGVSRGTIANWKSGYSLPDTVMCATLAGLTGLPLARVLGIVGEARAVSREEKAVWRKLAATAMALCLALGFALPHKAQAAVAGFDNAHGVYIMRNEGLPESMRSLAPLGNGSGSTLACLLVPPNRLTATTETPQIPQLSARISPQGRPRFPDLPQRCP
ncbi:helix-turn-helix domain-containing protein [Stenotrophomonas maltophilia]|nr:helix-turn-helix domain-containing protein [Stenotrophomonas maltophilia]